MGLNAKRGELAASARTISRCFWLMSIAIRRSRFDSGPEVGPWHHYRHDGRVARIARGTRLPGVIPGMGVETEVDRRRAFWPSALVSARGCTRGGTHRSASAEAPSSSPGAWSRPSECGASARVQRAIRQAGHDALDGDAETDPPQR